MKIAHIVGQLGVGGTEKSAVELCRRQSVLHEVALFSFKDGPRHEYGCGYHTEIVSDPESLTLALTKFKPDIVNMHRGGWTQDEMLAPIVTYRHCAGKKVCIVETNIFGDRDRGQLCHAIDAKVFVSEYIQDWYHKATPGEEDRCVIKSIYNPINVDPARELFSQYDFLVTARRRLVEAHGIQPGYFIAGRTGRSANHTGISTRALKNLKLMDIKIHLIALCPDQQMVDEMAGLPFTAIHEPIIDDMEMTMFLAGLDVYLHDRVDGETFGCALAEARAVGVPIISHRSRKYNAHYELLGGVLEGRAILNDDDLRTGHKEFDNCRIVKDDDSFVAYSLEIAETLVLTDRLSDVSFEDRVSSFDAEVVSKKYTQLYEQLLKDE